MAFRDRVKAMGMFPKIPDISELNAKFDQLINEIRLVQQAVRENTLELKRQGGGA